MDKSWWGKPWQSYGGGPGTQGRIAYERERRDELGIPSVDTTVRVLSESLRTGTTRVRTHVDGYVPLLALGGYPAADNLQRVDLATHLDLILQVNGPITTVSWGKRT